MTRWMAALLLPILAQGAEQLKITADSFYGNEEAKRSVFEGHVMIQKGRDELNASRVEVGIDEARQPIRYEAKGDVSFSLFTDNNASYAGRAERVVFLPLEQEYRFFGNVRLMQIDEQKQIDGDEVIVNIKAGTATAKGSGSRPVTMTFTLPEREK